MTDLRWDDLRVFLAVARHGSMTAAATELGVNTSTAQRRLTALEAALGARLFDRHPTGTLPTAAGEALLPHAERVEDALLGGVRAIAGHDSAPRGAVHLTAPEALLPFLVEPLAGLRVDYPDIDLQVSLSDRFLDLSRREADVALRPSRTPPEDAVGRRVASVSWSVYIGAFAREPDLSALPWVCFSDALSRLDAVQWWRAHHQGDDVLMTVNSVPAMHRVVACAPCRGLLPCFVGDADPTLSRAGPLLPGAESGLWLLLHPDLRRAARVRAVVDRLWESLRADVDLFEGRRP